MFNADSVVVKQPLLGMSHLRFVGSRLVTAARYVSGWTVPELNELFRVRTHSSPICIQPAGHLLLGRLHQKYRIIDVFTGDTVSAFSLGEKATAYGMDFHGLSACGRFVISGEQGTTRLREAATGAIVWERVLDRATLSNVWPLHDGRQWAFLLMPMYQGEGARPPDRVEVWDWPFGSQPSSILERPHVPYGSSVSNDGLIAFPGFATRPISIFDLKSAKLIREFAPPAGSQADNSGYAHWLSNGQLALAWRDVLCIGALHGNTLRTINVPTYSCHSVDSTDDLLALAYYDGFVLLPLDQIPESETSIALSPPWPDLPRLQRESAYHGFVMPAPDSHRTLVGETMEDMKKALQEFARPAWIPQVAFRPGDPASSKLGGTAFIAQNEEWPCCGVCSRPMELFLQLNAKDLPAEMSDRFSGLLQVFLCVTVNYNSGTCALPYESFSEASLLRLCKPVGQPRYQAPPFEDAFIEGIVEAWQRRVDLPSLAEVEGSGIELTDAQVGIMIDDGDEFAWHGDKLGGWPDWPQGVEYVACPRCRQRMDVIFQILSEWTLPHRFMDGGTAWISQCPEHPDVLALTWNS